MARRRYQFRDRAAAEEAYRNADRARLAAEWFASALISGKLEHVGTIDSDTCDGTTVSVGYFLTPHSAFVFAYTNNAPRHSPHCLRGVWDADSERLRDVITATLRYEDTREFGELASRARQAAERALYAGV